MSLEVPRRFLAVLVIICTAAAALPARGECPPFPETRWWDNLSHDATRRYVNFKHEGDWAAYLEKWQNQLKAAKRIYSEGKAAAMQRSGIRIQGEELRFYVESIEKRIEIIECLAREPAAAVQPAAPEPAIRATPPGKKTVGQSYPTFKATFDLPTAATAAREDWAALQVSVTVQCEADATRFVLTNRGAIWPAPAQIFILHRRNGSILAERALKMQVGQTFSLKAGGGAPMDLRIAAPWVEKEQRIVEARCD